MRVMFLGDTHGDLWWMRKRVLPAAIEAQVDLILQLGDWGFWWPGDDRDFKLNRYLTEAGIPMWFIDGNHDNHTRLRKLAEVDEFIGDVINPTNVPGHQLAASTPYLRYLPRGTRFELDGISFLALGGAYSIDKQGRTEGSSWWREEEITYAEAMKAMEGGRAMVMITHDMPLGMKLAWDRKDSFPESWANRKMIREVVDVVRPKWLFHGHMHFRQTTLLPLTGGHMVRVESLNCNDPMGANGAALPPHTSWMIKDTEDLVSITRDLDFTKVVRVD